MYITVKNILQVMKQMGLNERQFEINAKLPNGTIQGWKNGKSSPSRKTLDKISIFCNKPLSYFFEEHDKHLDNHELKDDQKLPDNLTPEEVVMFPVIGMIAAGYDGNVSFDPTGDEIPVPECLLKTHNPNDYFVLQVIGNSMLPTYHNGDKVLIRKTDSVDSGTIAAVGFDTENATLKKVEYAKGENWMKLIPLNPDFPVKEIKGADLDLCHVYGEVVCKFDNHVRGGDAGRFAEQFNSLSKEQQQTIMQLMKSMLN